MSIYREFILAHLAEHFGFNEATGTSSIGSHASLGVSLNNCSFSANAKHGDSAVQMPNDAGNASARLDVASALNFPNQSFAISTWFRPESNTSPRSDVGKQVVSRIGSGTPLQFVLGYYDSEIKSGNSNPAPGGIFVSLQADDDTIITATSSSGITTLGQYSMLTMSWDREANELKIWHNDQLEATASFSGGAKALKDGGYSTRFAGKQQDGSPNNAVGFHDSAFFVNAAIEQGHVDYLYNAGAGRTYGELLSGDPPSEEEVFQASFEDASGRDPLPTALLDRTPAKRLANHNVIVYKYPPYIVTKRWPIPIEKYPLTKPGFMGWFKDTKDPLFAMGRWAQIQGRRFMDDPNEVELVMRISDHPECFEAPT